jgi:hypothetical protein
MASSTEMLSKGKSVLGPNRLEGAPWVQSSKPVCRRICACAKEVATHRSRQSRGVFIRVRIGLAVIG